MDYDISIEDLIKLSMDYVSENGGHVHTCGLDIELKNNGIHIKR